MQWLQVSKNRISGYALLLCLAGTMIWFTSSAEDRHTISSDGLGGSQMAKDPKIGSPAPDWLAKRVKPPCLIIALSCTDCLSPAYFEHFKETSESVYVIMSVKDDKVPAWITNVWPEERVLLYPKGDNGLNAWFAPRSYRLDAQGRFSYIQRKQGGDPLGEQ